MNPSKPAATDIPDAAPTDAQLIAESATRPRAFLELLERHQRILYGYMARRVGPDLAEDIVAETFTRAFALRERFDQARDDARPWLFGIALNLLRTHMRSETRKSRAYQRSGAALLDEAPDDDEVADRLDASLHGDTLTNAVKTLSQGDREALLLYAWGDLSYDDIALSLNIPVGTVRSRLNRARRQLREQLANTGVRPEHETADIPDSSTAAGGQ